MFQRFAFLIASVAAVAVLVVGLTAVGAASPAPRVPSATSTTPLVASVDSASPPSIKVDTVYLAAPKKARTVVVHKVVPSPRGERDDQSEASGD